jgi:hypothetical protein
MNDLTTKPQKMFDNARAYSKASYILNQKALGRSFNVQDMDLGLPSMVNAALALELYFKTVYLLEKGEDFKVKGRNSHDFHLLFGELNNSTRQSMEAVFIESMRRRDMTDVEKIERDTSVSIPRDLVSNLFVWKDVFVDIRYIHERKGKGMLMFFFPEIKNAVLAPIFLLKPEWEHLTSVT